MQSFVEAATSLREILHSCTMKATAVKGIPADNILSEVNNILVEDPANMFVTVFFSIFDTRTGSLEYSNGGHNLPFRISEDGMVVQLDNPGGFVLGAMKNIEYCSGRLMLKPGDTIFFYTDGVTEAFSSNEEQFSENRLVEVLKQNHLLPPCQLTESVIAEVKSFTGTAEQSDDITCLTLKFIK